MASETRPGLLAFDGRLDLLGYYLCIARISGAGSGVGNEAGAVVCWPGLSVSRRAVVADD